MGAARWKLGSVGSAFFVLAAFAQPVAADPIYYLVQGAQYSPGNGIGTFIIPSVAQGLLFYLNADDRSVEITLTGLFNASGEKVRCIAVTRFAFACSAEAVLGAYNGDNPDSGDPNGEWFGRRSSLAVPERARCEWFGRRSGLAVPDREHCK